MPSKRIKSNTTITTQAAFEATVDDICRLQLDHEQLTTLRDRLLMEIREEHDPEIERIGKEIKEKLVLCEKFAISHRNTIFGRLKSAAASLGHYGFRIGNPTLKLLNRKWKWADVVATLQATKREELLRTKIEANKDALKRLPPEELATIGLRIDQDETFYIEPKRDNPERVQ